MHCTSSCVSQQVYEASLLGKLLFAAEDGLREMCSFDDDGGIVVKQLLRSALEYGGEGNGRAGVLLAEEADSGRHHRACVCEWCEVGAAAGPGAGPGERARVRNAYHEKHGPFMPAAQDQVCTEPAPGRMMAMLAQVRVGVPPAKAKAPKAQRGGAEASRKVGKKLGMSPYDLQVLEAFDPACKVL